MSIFLIGLMGGLSTLISLLWSSPFLLLNIFGIKLCVSSSKQQFNNIKKVIIGASIWREQEPEGWIYGLFFFGIFEK